MMRFGSNVSLTSRDSSGVGHLVRDKGGENRLTYVALDTTSVQIKLHAIHWLRPPTTVWLKGLNSPWTDCESVWPSGKALGW